MDLSVFFAGTAGSIPTARRGLPAVLVRRGGDRILIDCGEGTQRQLVQSVGLTELTEVFLTHFHADHWLGLPGLLKTFDLRARERPLAIHGPPGLRELITLALRAAGRVRYELELIELAPGDLLPRDGYTIAPVPVAHRGGQAFGYVIYEDERPGQFDPETATALGVVPGPEFGRLQHGETVRGVRPEQVLGPPRAGRKIVISGDTSPCETLQIASHEADLLLHEATFAEEEHDRAAETGHSTAAQAATLARDAGVTMLALTHFSTRYPVSLIRDEARAIFPRTVLPRDFDSIEIPFPERGEPELIRWEDRQPTEDEEAAAMADTAGMSTGTIERLETERLVLERLRVEHAPEECRLLCDPRVGATLWSRPTAPSEAEIINALAAKVDHWDRHGFGTWLIRDRETGEAVGRGGLQYTFTAGLHDVEAGWAIIPERWGQGLATELAFACIEVGFEQLGLRRIVAFTLPDNVASRRVMEKAGFEYERDIVHAGLTHVLYVRGGRRR